jgi:hypothetical protein
MVSRKFKSIVTFGEREGIQEFIETGIVLCLPRVYLVIICHSYVYFMFCFTT